MTTTRPLAVLATTAIVLVGACGPPSSGVADHGDPAAVDAADVEPDPDPIESAQLASDPAAKLAICVSSGDPTRWETTAALLTSLVAGWVDLDPQERRPPLQLTARVMPSSDSFASQPLFEGSIRAQSEAAEALDAPSDRRSDYETAEEFDKALQEFFEEQDRRQTSREAARVDAERLLAELSDEPAPETMRDTAPPDFAGCAAAVRTWLAATPALAQVFVVVDDDGVDGANQDHTRGDPTANADVHLVGVFDAPSAERFEYVAASYSWFSAVTGARSYRAYAHTEQDAAASHILEHLEADNG